MKEKIMSEPSYYIWLDAKADDEEIPAWKRLDIVTRKWAALSGFEKDQDTYAKMKEYYA
jgi:hypothetical protein